MKVAGGSLRIVAHGNSYYTDVECVDGKWMSSHHLAVEIGVQNFYT
jgi:hypothetical protein